MGLACCIMTKSSISLFGLAKTGLTGQRFPLFPIFVLQKFCSQAQEIGISFQDDGFWEIIVAQNG